MDKSLDEILIHEKNHIFNAALVGAFYTILTLLLSIIGIFNEEIRVKHGFDAWGLIDVAILAALTYGVYKRNRYSALSLLLYFIIGKIVSFNTNSGFYGILFGIIFSYFYFQGVRACFHLHKLTNNKEEGERTKSWKYKIGFFILSILSLGFLIFMTLVALGPKEEVLSGIYLDKKYKKFLKENKLINSGEEIEYWYSDGFTDFKDGFYFFTNEKVVLYKNNWEEKSILIPYLSIQNIEFEKQASYYEDSKITITMDDSYVTFPVSSTGDGDEKFIKRLLQIWKRKIKEEEK
ncbi:MAG: hypothetical protein GW938_05645 [Leptospira sp.]|nr:hypothetical protein [Leptospira sp.]NCS94126.1 hypothetical protein [Leptospira sp.]